MASLPRVLSVQSHVVHGYVGNRAAVFPLQLLGFEVDVINSVQFCCHTGYPSFSGQRLSGDDLQTLVQGLCQNQVLNHSFLLTGYIGAVSFLQEVLKLRQQLPKSCCYVCDPVLGDNGHLYVPEDLVAVYRSDVLQHVSILTPNQFEAELLTQRTISSIDDAAEACDALHAKGPSMVVLTTLDVPDATRDGSDVAMLLSISGQKKWMLRLPRIEGGPFTGTGDLTAAMILAWTHRKPDELPLALEKAGAILQAVIRKTVSSSSTQVIGEKRVPPELRIIESKLLIEAPCIKHRCQLVSPLNISGIVFQLDTICDVQDAEALRSLRKSGMTVCVFALSAADARKQISDTEIKIMPLPTEAGALEASLSSAGLGPSAVLAVGATRDFLSLASAAGCTAVAMSERQAEGQRGSNGYSAKDSYCAKPAEAEFAISSLDSLRRFVPAWDGRPE